MKQLGKINLKKGDILLIIFLLCLCGVLFAVYSMQSGSTATVTVDGETVFEADLSQIKEESEITLENGVVIKIAPGEIYFYSSPCKNKDCIKCGKLTKAGQCAVCLPQKTVIKISGKTDGKLPDAIT